MSRTATQVTSRPDSFTPRRVGLDHLAFGVADEVELEAWRARLDELRIPHDAIDDYGYGLAITLRDPDGIALECICPPRKEISQP